MPGELATSSSARLPKTFEEWYYALAFLGIHLLCLAAIFTGVPLEALLLCFGLWAFRMFAITAGYHRYFSHRSYEMGRVMQFVMAFLSQTAMQRGVLWWAAHHRHHHKHSDQPEDVHSPVQENFLWSHFGWVIAPEWADTDMSKVKDLAKYPELRLLDRYHHIPGLLLAFGCWLWMGWAGVIVGFLWSTVAVWHTAFTINSVAHVVGSRRYDTEDDSRNNWFLALLTFGEGWHNNHHHYQASVRQGFYWWEIDLTYYILWMMSKVGLVSNLREPPEHVVEDRPHPAKVARQAREDFEERAGWLTRHAQTIREHAERHTDELGDDLTDRARQLGEDIEQRLQPLREAAEHAGRTDAQQLEQLAADAAALGDEMNQRLTELRKDAAARSEQARRVVDGLIPQPDAASQQASPGMAG